MKYVYTVNLQAVIWLRECATEEEALKKLRTLKRPFYVGHQKKHLTVGDVVQKGKAELLHVY